MHQLVNIIFLVLALQTMMLNKYKQEFLAHLKQILMMEKVLSLMKYQIPQIIVSQQQYLQFQVIIFLKK